MPFDNGTFTKLYDWLGNKTDIPRKRGDSLNQEFENFSDGLTDLKSEIDAKDARYAQLSGATFTGNLKVLATTAEMRVESTDDNKGIWLDSGSDAYYAARIITDRVEQRLFVNGTTEAYRVSFQQHLWRINAAEAMRLTSNGNLGIGDSNPPDKLTVSGNVSLSGGAPYVTLLETDDNTAGRLMVDQGTVYVQAGAAGSGKSTSSGKIHLSGYNGTELSELKVNMGGWQDVLHTGNTKLPSYTVATVPSASASGAGFQIYVTDETGGAVPAFSDGTDWRRATDRSVIA